MQRSRVLFPDPLEPIKQTTSLSLTVKSIPLSNFQFTKIFMQVFNFNHAHCLPLIYF